MPTQRYSVTEPHVETLFAWIKSGEIAIPEIQRPFVWSAVKVRNLLDSLFQGYPVGYLIAWCNPDVKLKDGTSSAGKRILIDGQQRVTALMASLLGQVVVNKDYEQIRIRIAFHPGERRFEVSNPAIQKNSVWIPDISIVFDPETSLLDLVDTYCARNSGSNRDQIFRSIELLKGITSNQIGLIELAPDLDIETVTEIFIRVNSEGVLLSQADFAMSKIAANETFGGNMLRKAIDYFCHVAASPEFFSHIQRDQEFVNSVYYPQMTWLRHADDDLYDPSYTDMLRVAFISKFGRGRLADLVSLLSGRNFETRQYEDSIAEESFTRLRNGILQFMNETHFKRFLMIIRSTGFVVASMIGSQNALDFGYVLYLALREAKLPAAEIERQVRRWFVMSILTGRYSSGAPETAFDYDIRLIREQGIVEYAENVIRGEMSSMYWEVLLPQSMNTSVASSPYFRLFQAAQIKMNDCGFLSQDITVRELVEVKSDVHHIFPRAYLKGHGLGRGQYNQIANFTVTQSEINIAISNKEPRAYFAELLEQCSGGLKRYGNISNMDLLNQNFSSHCIPEGIETMTADDYPDFLVERRKLMANKIRRYFEAL